MRGEVVVQEELAAHEEEGEVVGGPGEEEEAGGIVEAGARAWATDCGLVSICVLTCQEIHREKKREKGVKREGKGERETERGLLTFV